LWYNIDNERERRMKMYFDDFDMITPEELCFDFAELAEEIGE
jgi:hypothetical protein